MTRLVGKPVSAGWFIIAKLLDRHVLTTSSMVLRSTFLKNQECVQIMYRIPYCNMGRLRAKTRTI